MLVWLWVVIINALSLQYLFWSPKKICQRLRYVAKEGDTEVSINVPWHFVVRCIFSMVARSVMQTWTIGAGKANDFTTSPESTWWIPLPRTHPIYHRMMTSTPCFLFSFGESCHQCRSKPCKYYAPMCGLWHILTCHSFEVGIQGKKGLILSPAIYQVSTPIQITQPHFVILGLGFPTLVSMETWQIGVLGKHGGTNANFLQGKLCWTFG